jgi:hypothetical protein
MWVLYPLLYFFKKESIMKKIITGFIVGLLVGILTLTLTGCTLTDHLIHTDRIPNSGNSNVNLENTVRWTVRTIGEVGLAMLGVGGVAGGGIALRRRAIRKKNGTGTGT